MERLFAGVEDFFAGMERLFAGMERLFAGMERLFAGVECSFAGMEGRSTCIAPAPMPRQQRFSRPRRSKPPKRRFYWMDTDEEEAT